MKKCQQCEQAYGDDTNFCLSDGSALVPVSGSYTSLSDAPTVVSDFPFTPPTTSASSSEIPTVVSNFPFTPPPTSATTAETQGAINNLPFTPPVSYAPTEAKKSNTLLIALVVGFFALVVGGAIVGLVMYGLSDSGNTNVANISNSADKSNKNSAEQRSGNDNLAENLKQQQEKIEKDKQKLENERKALEAKKKEAAQTPKPSTATTAAIIDPPTNIRATPNGTIICVMRQRGTIVNILGSTGVSDNNGTWYYTDACGRTGVIHSSQIRF